MNNLNLEIKWLPKKLLNVIRIYYNVRSIQLYKTDINS